MNLPADLKVILHQKVNLADHCTMRVGGEAAYYAEPSNEEELLELLDFARHEHLHYVVIGRGSNVLFPDDGYAGLVISMTRFDENHLLVDKEAKTVYASGAVLLSKLSNACKDAGLAGAEFLGGIPGTVGGALIMNAGYSRFPGQRNQIGDIVLEVSVMTPEGRRSLVSKGELKFSYRQSNLNGSIILGAKLKLWKRDRETIEKEMKENFYYRNRYQDLDHPSCGSVFKNPIRPKPSARSLIEKLGLKGMRIGDAMVSVKHGNFIINAGNAKSSEVIELIQKIQKLVFDATEILLEPEIRIIQQP